LVAALGMGMAYVVIAGLYTTSLLLTLRVARVPRSMHGGDATTSGAGTSPWRDLKDGLAYVWTTPQVLAAMLLAFLVNLTAFPLVMGLMPYVAREIYRTDQTGLGYLVASWALGALIGSITLSRIGHAIRPGRVMIAGCLAWYAMIMVFAHMPGPASGGVFLMLAGFAQSLGMVSMSVMLLRAAGEQFRGSVMGMRMLMVYGVPIGLLIAGPLIGRFGYPLTATLYCLIGLAVTWAIAVRWRTHVWNPSAPANKR
jgi:Na+/melibiose symporter-like transporter